MKNGIQTYTLRNLIKSKADAIDIFRKLTQVGAEAIEITNLELEMFSPNELHEISKTFNLEIGSSHSPFDRFANDIERLVNDHLAFDCKNIGLGILPRQIYNTKNIDDILAFCDLLNKSAQVCANYGVNVDYHNHDFEFNILNNQTILDTIILNTSKNVKICFDMYWAKVMGYDVRDYLKKYPDKINILHFKDCKKGIFKPKMTVLGEGQLELEKIYATASENKVSYAYVELDSCKDPLYAVKKGIEMLNSFKKS